MTIERLDELFERRMEATETLLHGAAKAEHLASLTAEERPIAAKAFTAGWRAACLAIAAVADAEAER